MTESVTIELTRDMLDSLSIEDIIYAEITKPGAMGNNGGIMVYIIEDEILYCNETNIYNDEGLYFEIEELLQHYHYSLSIKNIWPEKVLFDLYDGGFGNSVLINKNASLKIAEEFFIYTKNNKEYSIYSSVQGVFLSVVHALKKQK